MKCSEEMRKRGVIVIKHPENFEFIAQPAPGITDEEMLEVLEGLGFHDRYEAEEAHALPWERRWWEDMDLLLTGRSLLVAGDPDEPIDEPSQDDLNRWR